MSRFWIAAIVAACTLAATAQAEAQTAGGDDVQRQLASLAERIGKLETENATLKQRNADLERRVAQLEPAPVAATGSPAAVPPVPAPDHSAAAVPAEQPWYEKVKVGGLMFGDAYAVLANHDDAIDGQTGFWIRRGYLTFDARLATDWSARLRFEFNSPGDFETSSKASPFVKDAHLAWKRGGQELYLGLAATPTFNFVEGFWGERPIEKTPVDLYRMGGSSDLGVAYRGQVDDGKVFYHAMIGNGSSDGAETNKGKKVMGALGFKPVDALVVQLYADYEDRPGATDRGTMQAFAGWKTDRSRYGLLYAMQDREVEQGPDQRVAVASVFGVWQLTQKGSLVARYDRSFDGYSDADKIPYLRIANDMKFDLAILAWEQRLQPRISLIPNLEYVAYRDTNGVEAPGDDLYGRLTLYFEF